MRKSIYTKTRNFRMTSRLDQELQSLADTVNRHESDLIREAIAKFVLYYRTCPDQIVKIV